MTTSFSPLAMLLPERTTPDLLYLETKWAALMSYGLTVKLLQAVLPIDEPLEAVTIRNHVLTWRNGWKTLWATNTGPLLSNTSDIF
jgi:hypothetical protein